MTGDTRRMGRMMASASYVDSQARVLLLALRGAYRRGAATPCRRVSATHLAGEEPSWRVVAARAEQLAERPVAYVRPIEADSLPTMTVYEVTWLDEIDQQIDQLCESSWADGDHLMVVLCLIALSRYSDDARWPHVDDMTDEMLLAIGEGERTARRRLSLML